MDGPQPQDGRARAHGAAPEEPWDAVLDERIAGLWGEGTATGDPASAEIRATARTVYAARAEGGIIAEVVNDSVDDPPSDLRAVADLAASPRYVRFHAAGLTVRLEVAVADDGRDIVGRVSPTDVTGVEVRWPGGSMRREIDESGSFAARAVPRGPVSIRLHRAAGPCVSTPWLAY